MKRNLLYLSLAALVLYIIGRFFLLDAAVRSHNPLFALVSLLIYPLAAGLLALVAWILGLVKTAQTRRWGWFVAIFFVPVIGTLLYGLLGPPDQPADVPMMQPAQWQDPYWQAGQGQGNQWRDTRWQDSEGQRNRW